MISHYYLPGIDGLEEQGYVIEKEDNCYIWIAWMILCSGFKIKKGTAYMMGNFLYIRNWQIVVKDAPIYKNLDDAKEYMETLNRWDKTPFFVKSTGIGEMLCFCASGIALTPQEETALMPDFWKKRWEYRKRKI